MTKPTTIEPFLTAVLERYRAGKSPAERDRIDRLDTLLRRCLEEVGTAGSCADCQRLLEAERVFDPVGAFARVMHVESLVYVLVYFVHAPWLRADPQLRDAQWRFVEVLLDAAESTAMPASDQLVDALVTLREHIWWGQNGGRRRRGSRG